MSELFLTVFNTAVTAGWLVLAVLAARLLLKNAPGWAKCALWAVVGLRLIWPFDLESILSLVPSKQTLPPAELTASAPQIHTGIRAMNSVINPTFTQTFAPVPEQSVNPLQIVVAVASVVWIIGMVAMAVYAFVSYLRLRRRVAVSIPAGDGVYLCDAISSPFILGLIKPKIYLPSNLPREQWDAILSHERAHLARRDHWWKPLGFALLTVFWFHPLLWVAYILLCRDVELACDEKVIKALSPEEKQTYSEILLAYSMPRRWIAACPLAFGETDVKTRIKAVLHYKKPTLWVIIAALVICSVLAVCFLTEPVTDQSGTAAAMLFDRDYEDPDLQGEVMLDGFRNVSVRWDLTQNLITSEEKPVLFKDGTESILFEDYPPPTSLYLADITRDGKPDLCAEVYFPFSGFPSFNAVCVYDIAGDQYYLLGNGDNMFLNQWVSYDLRIENGNLLCDQYSARDDVLLATGTLILSDIGENMTLCFDLQTVAVTEADIAGKQYVYTKPGAGGAFYINIYAGGTFQYYAGNYSSHIGLGDWELKGNILYLYDITTTNPMTFVFSVGEDQLAYIAAESHPFMYVDVADGDVFRYYCDLEKLIDPVTASDLAGKSFTCRYKREVDGGYFTDTFTLILREDGKCWFHTSGLSSQMQFGSWSLEEGKLYVRYAAGEGEGVATFDVKADLALHLESPFYTLSEGAVFELPKSNLVWIEVTTLNDENNYIIGKDSEGNFWRILLTNRMTRRDLQTVHGGVWVRFYGEPEELHLSSGSLRYEVTAEACWQYVEDESLSSRENVRGLIYDYCLYDVDNDGNVEECILSMGHTSGLFTIHYSVWQDGECEEEKHLYIDGADGFAFDPDENGLAILTSNGLRYYPGLYSNGS